MRERGAGLAASSRRRASTGAGAAIAALLALAGCATDTLRLDRATALGTAGTRATGATRALIRAVDAANRQTAIDIASLDRACRLPSPVIIAPDARGPATSICRRGPQQPGDFVLRRLDPHDVAPALAVVEALATYLGAVDAIAAAEPIDYGAEFAAAEGKLAAIDDDLAAITGNAAVTLPTGEQLSAIAGALTLIGTLTQEHDKVARLRALERPEETARFAATAAALRRVDAAWTSVLKDEIDKQTLVTELVVMRVRPRSPESRDLRTRQMDLIDRTGAVAALASELAKTVDALTAAHDAYLALLFDAHAGLSAKERRRRAKLIETRLLSALNGLAALAAAF